MSSMLEIDHASARVEWLHILCTKHHKSQDAVRLSRGPCSIETRLSRRPSRKVSIACFQFSSLYEYPLGSSSPAVLRP